MGQDKRRIVDEPAYVLHARPYRETSALIDLLTLQHGRVSVVARGARGSRRGSGQPQPFGRLLIACGGRGSLLTLTGCDALSHRWLTGEALYAGLYLNELLLRVVRDGDPHPRLFDGYETALDGLIGAANPEPALRRFERLVLKESGYEVTFDVDADSGEPVVATRGYTLVPDSGFHAVTQPIDERTVFAGSTLLAIAMDDYRDDGVRRSAKQIMRRALAPHLGDKPIRSRTLYRRDLA